MVSKSGRWAGGLVVLLTVVILGAAQAAEVKTEEEVKTDGVIVDNYIRTADNFIIMYDASGSMSRLYEDTGMRMIDAAQKALKEKNALLPDLDFNAGLYLYTPWQVFYEMQPYDKAKFAAAIESLPDTDTAGSFKGQPTPLVEGLEKLDPILAKVSGRTVVILFSDGSYKLPVSKKRPLDVVKTLSAKYDVSFYVISSADIDRNVQMLRSLVQVNARSRVIPFKWLLGHPHRTIGALYTVNSVALEASQRETVVTGMDVQTITFDVDEPNIRPEDRARLAKLGAFLKANPEADVLLEGFTDAAGAEDDNLHLSRRRAFRVMQYLMDEFQIARTRIVVHWYGALNPVADNSTPEGRAQNRRVEVQVVGLN
ncbi:MAG: OmpA family protein [Desulfobacterales bacterium]